MVKVPVGETVKVDLWNPEKRSGMVKYFTNTMDLVRAESQFELQKDDNAIVVESYDSFVVIVPKDEYTSLLKGYNLKNLNLKGLPPIILKILKERKDETGGILSFEELFSILKRTSIQNVITKKHLKKVLSIKNNPFDTVKLDNVTYVVMKPEENPEDQAEILKFSETHAYVMLEFLKRELQWSDIRLMKALDYLVEKGVCRREGSYRTGETYYFQKV